MKSRSIPLFFSAFLCVLRGEMVYGFPASRFHPAPAISITPPSVFR